MAKNKRTTRSAPLAVVPDADEPLPVDPVPLAARLALPPKAVATRSAKEVAKRARSVSITLRVPERGLERARMIAEKKGLPYQTYLKMLIHEGLERDKSILSSH